MQIKPIYFFLFVAILLQPWLANAQNKIKIAATPFEIFSLDSLYNDLSVKMPGYICNGLVSDSKYQAYMLSGEDKLNTRINNNDSNFVKKYKPLFEKENIKYLIEGRVVITNGQFFIKVDGTDFKNKFKPYTSALKSLSDFQLIVNEAYQNLIYQIRQSQGDEQIKKVFVNKFSIEFPKENNFINYADQTNTLEYLPRYLNRNLKNSQKLLILPASYQSFNDSVGILGMMQKADIVVTGASVDDGKFFSISPVIIVKSDSIHLLVAKGSNQNKSIVLSKTLANIQSFLDGIADIDTVDISKIFHIPLEEKAYENAYENAYAEKKYLLAFYYAEQLSVRFQNSGTRSDLLKAKVYYQQREFDSSLTLLSRYLQIDNLNKEANYYMALSYMKKGDYEIAKSFLSKADSPAFNDVYFQRGLCLYYQDSVLKALANFQAQIATNNMSIPEVYNYAANCYEKLNDFSNAEKMLLVLSGMNPASEKNNKTLSLFYLKRAQFEYDSLHYLNALQYNTKSYSLFKSYKSLYGAVTCNIRLQSNTDILNKQILAGITDSIFDQSSIYYDLATFCRNEVDSNGNYIPWYLNETIYFFKAHVNKAKVFDDPEIFQTIATTYFHLKKFDSTEAYYKKVLLLRKDDPLDYFNLIELQLTILKTDNAIATLNKVNLAFNFKTNKNFDEADRDIYAALYYFYLVEAKIIKKENYTEEWKELKLVMKKYLKEPVALLNNWTFRTFYLCMKENKNIDLQTRKKLLEKLCDIVPYTIDPFPCPD